MLLCGPAKDLEGACHTKLSLARGGFGHKLEDVALQKLGSKAAPWLPTAKRVEVAKVPQVTRHTLRIAAPNFFRAPFLNAKSQDTPTQIITSLAQLGECSPSEFCGGRWSTQEKKEGTQLIVFLRLKKPLHEKLLSVSGQHGLFMTAVANKNEEKIDITPFWVKRNPREDHESYHRRILSLQQTRRQPVLFRFGTGDVLGFPKKQTDVYAPKDRLHLAHGIPTSWGEDEVTKFFNEQEWTNLGQLSGDGHGDS